MRTITIHASDAIAAFLRAELDSPTESARLRAVLERLRIDARVLSRPGAGSGNEETLLWTIFDVYRGRETLFDTLDLRALEWVRASLSAEDLEKRVRTCRHPFEARYGTRDPGRIAAALNASGEPNGVLDRIREGAVLEPPLLVGTPRVDRLVILEGHNRILSYLRDLSAVALPVPVILGFSDKVKRWREWL